MYRLIITCGVIITAAFSQLFAAADNEPQIEVLLVADERYLGEVPCLRIVITAPPGAAIKTRSPGSFELGETLTCELVGAKGTRITNPTIRRTPKPGAEDNSVVVAAGKSIEYLVPVLCRPSVADDYCLKCELRPLIGRDGFVVRKEFKIRYVDVPSDRIANKAVVPIRDERMLSNPFVGKVEIIVAKSSRAYEVIYRRIRMKENDEEHYLQRVLPLDHATNVVAMARFFDRQDVVQEVWVTYTKGEEMWLLRLGFVTGDILDNIPLSKALETIKKLDK